MELKGKKIVFLGDSITYGAGTSDLTCKIYWQVLQQLSGAQCIGYGIGGHRIARQQTPEEGDRVPFADRVDTMDADADIVVVFGGTNDFGHGDAAFGTMDDRTLDTFCGAVHVLCLKLLERYPDAQLVFMTPTHRCNENDGPYNLYGTRRAANLEGYVNAIQQIAGYYGIPVLDLFRTSGIQPNVPLIRERYMPDGLHPNDAGNERIARRLLGFLQSL